MSVRRVLPGRPQTLQDLLRYPREAPLVHVDRSSCFVPVQPQQPRVASTGAPPPDEKAAAAKAKALDAEAKEKIPCPVDKDTLVGAKQWAKLHKAGTVVAQTLRHKQRAQLWDFVAARLSYPEKPTVYGSEPDALPDGSGDVPLSDYHFDWEGNDVQVGIYGGYLMITDKKNPFKSTRTAQSDIDASINVSPDMSDGSFKRLGTRFVDAIKDAELAIGLMMDCNFYVGSPVRHPSTRAVTALDMHVAEIFSEFESPETLQRDVGSIFMKAAIQLDMSTETCFAVAPVGNDPNIYSAGDTRKVIDDVKHWYRMQAGDDRRARETEIRYLARRAETEAALYANQFLYGRTARTLVQKILAEDDDEKRFSHSQDLAYVISLLGVIKLEGYVNPFSVSLTVLQQPSRTLSSAALLSAQLEQLSDGLVKVISTANKENSLRHSSFKPKVIGRLSRGLIESRSEVIDPTLHEDIESLIVYARQRLSSAEADRSLTDGQRKEAIAAATRYLDASAALALLAIDDDLNDGSDGACKSETCNKLKSLVDDIDGGGTEEDRLAALSTTQLYNHVAGKLLINATRSLVAVLGMKSTVCTVLSQMEQRVAYLDRVYEKQSDEKLRANQLATLLARLDGAGREVPEGARRSLTDLASWLTDGAVR